MAKEKETSGDKNIIAIEGALSKTEHFIEKNQKAIMIVVGAIIIVVLGYFGFKKFYLAPKETAAQSAMFWAERYFEKDSLRLALDGDGTNAGFLEIADNYGMTKSANLAHYYAGIIYLRQGKYEEAIEQLKSFDGDDEIISGMALGGIGDSYMELGDNDMALKYYLKAANKNDNKLTTPLFLMKAGWTYEIMNNYSEALKLYERIRTDYYKSSESRDIDKYIARAKGLLDQK